MGRRLNNYITDFKSTLRYGVIAAYDEEYDRLLLTYKDYDIITDFSLTGGATLNYNGGFYIEDDLGRFDVDLGAPKYFKNRSFTKSYSFTNGWISDHSFVPDFYLYGESSVYSGQFNKLWKHNSGEFLVYYGSRYSFIVDLVYKENEPTIWDGISFTSFAYKNGAISRWVTFDEAIVYNSYQSTGLQPLTTKDSLEGEWYLRDTAQGSFLLDLFNETWNLNGFRDLVGNYEVSLFNETSDYRLTDKESNLLAFTGKEWYNTEPIKDRYVQVRLIFKGRPGTSLTFVLNQAYGRDRR